MISDWLVGVNNIVSIEEQLLDYTYAIIKNLKTILFLTGNQCK